MRTRGEIRRGEQGGPFLSFIHLIPGFANSPAKISTPSKPTGSASQKSDRENGKNKMILMMSIKAQSGIVTQWLAGVDNCLVCLANHVHYGRTCAAAVRS